MKKIIVLAALICALAAFAGRPSADVPRQADIETLSPMAMMQESRTLSVRILRHFLTSSAGPRNGIVGDFATFRS